MKHLPDPYMQSHPGEIQAKAAWERIRLRLYPTGNVSKDCRQRRYPGGMATYLERIRMGRCPDGKVSGWDCVRMGRCPDGGRLKRKSGGGAVRAEISEAAVWAQRVPPHLRPCGMPPPTDFRSAPRPFGSFRPAKRTTLSKECKILNAECLIKLRMHYELCIFHYVPVIQTKRGCVKIGAASFCKLL